MPREPPTAGRSGTRQNRVQIEVAARSRLLAICTDENSRKKMQNVCRDSWVCLPSSQSGAARGGHRYRSDRRNDRGSHSEASIVDPAQHEPRSSGDRFAATASRLVSPHALSRSESILLFGRGFIEDSAFTQHTIRSQLALALSTTPLAGDSSDHGTADQRERRRGRY